MACDRWQQAISALADGEDPGVEPRLLDAHLAGCSECAAFAAFTSSTAGAGRLHAAPVMPDLSRRVTRLNAVADRAASLPVARILLTIVGVEVIVFALRALILGDDSESSVHAARHLGAFSIAYGVGLLVVAVRPARARTMLPVAAVLAGALAITAVVDMVNGEAPLVNETSHLPELLSVLLVWLLAVPADRRRPWRRPAPVTALRAVGDSDGPHARSANG